MSAGSVFIAALEVEKMLSEKKLAVAEDGAEVPGVIPCGSR